MKPILSAIVLLCPVAVWAQDIRPIDIKPGLWENTTTSQISGVKMPQLSEEQLAQMPPEARARLQGMMGGAPQTNITKACITKEDLTKPLMGSGDKSCTYKMLNSSGSSQSIHAECVRGNSKTVGDVTLNRVDSEHLKGSMDMKTTGDSSASGAAAGQNMTIKLTFSNKFLSSDCGNVKPGSRDK